MRFWFSYWFKGAVRESLLRERVEVMGLRSRSMESVDGERLGSS